MGNRRSLSWNKALSDLRADRDQRDDIREERLRAPTPRGMPPVTLSAWRGRSGKRHIVSVHPPAPAALAKAPAAYLAVRRDGTGKASIVSAAHDLSAADAEAWLAGALKACATEIHVHSLSESPELRGAFVRDVHPEA